MFDRLLTLPELKNYQQLMFPKPKPSKTSIFHPFQLNNNTRPRKPRVVAMRRLLPHTMLSLMDSPDFGETYSSSQWVIWLIRMEDYKFTNVEYESWYSQLIRIKRINPTTEQRVNHDTRIPYLPSWMVDVYGKLAGIYAVPPIWVMQLPKRTKKVVPARLYQVEIVEVRIS